MRVNYLAPFAAAIAAIGLAAAEPAVADGAPAAKPAKAPVVAHYRPTHARYVRGPWPGGPDPYAYSYERRKYYPYYNSAYWVPRHQMKGRTRYAMRLPGYASSWGYPLACKIHGRKSCGVPFKSPPGDPRHYYDRY